MDGSHGDLYSWRYMNGEVYEKTIPVTGGAEQEEDAFLGVEALIRPSVFSAPNELAMDF
jgi:hypothetical protein